LLASCAPRNRLTYTQAMKQAINNYRASANRQLLPYFKRAGVPYPPRQAAFLIFKRSRRFELWARNGGNWRYIRTFRVLAASGGPGPKLHSGDRQVPEGIYHIIGMNPRSRFDLSLHLSYPNAFDRYHARLDHRTNLGGDIFIHGNKRSIGCVAIGNAAIQQIFPLVYDVGDRNVTVIIAPNDLRTQKPARGRVHPVWLPQLYAKIRQALAPFHGG